MAANTNNIGELPPKKKAHPTNSAEWLLAEAERKKAQLKSETIEERMKRLALLHSYWNKSKDIYNKQRREKRAEARAKLIASHVPMPRVGRPADVAPPAPTDLSYIQGQSKIRDMVGENVTYKFISVPKDLGVVFNDTSDRPTITLNEDHGTWPIYYIKPFNRLKEKTRLTYMRNFAFAMAAAGYSVPENPTNDPEVYSNWYGATEIDPFKVVRANSQQLGLKDTTSTDKTGTANARSSALVSVIVQGLLQCLKEDNFNDSVCKKLLKDHFVYFAFGTHAKKKSGEKFNRQEETQQDRDNTIEWGEWMREAREFISKVFVTDGAKAGQLVHPLTTNAERALGRDAMVVSIFSLIPITRLSPWDSTRIQPVGYNKTGAERLTSNYVTKDGRLFFNDFKNASSVRAFAGTPTNEPYEQIVHDPLFKKILLTWLSVNPTPFLLPSSFTAKSSSSLKNKLSTVVLNLSASIDKNKRRFGDRLMRRAFIKYSRTKVDLNNVNKMKEFMLSVHHTNQAINAGYGKGSLQGALHDLLQDVGLDDNGEVLPAAAAKSKGKAKAKEAVAVAVAPPEAPFAMSPGFLGLQAAAKPQAVAEPQAVAKPPRTKKPVSTPVLVPAVTPVPENPKKSRKDR